MTAMVVSKKSKAKASSANNLSSPLAKSMNTTLGHPSILKSDICVATTR
ncbi:UNVERIFIED_CONTAM: hypothetical protein GTU68_056514 [Idotea baltica]|nr:hypothetical protein [Idotea baltica]